MKKIITGILLIFFVSGVNAAETSKPSPWGENSSVFNQGFESQKQISDTKLNKTIETLKERALSRKQQKIRREVQPVSPAYDEEHLDNFASEDPEVNDMKNGRTVMIPVQAYDENGKYIQPGYYKLSCRKIAEDKYVLELSQGTTRIVSVPAMQTKQDLEQETINFCNSEIIDKNRIRLMYGSIDLNLVGYIYFKE